MPLLLAIIYAICAGIINGSFALPSKRTKQWQFEHIWLNFALWAFLIIPWVSIFFFDPNVMLVYRHLAFSTLLIVGIGGLLFGIGQICFAQALKKIGQSLSFLLNISIGTGVGFLLPLIILHPHEFNTSFGLMTITGTILILFGLILSYKAGKKSDISKKVSPANLSEKHYYHHHQAHYPLGIILAIMAGIFFGLQNFTFAATHEIQLTALQIGLSDLAASVIIWPIFLTFTFIPYVAYMIYLHLKHKSIHLYFHRRSFLNIQLAILMGLFWYGSLILYSKAALLIGTLGPIVAWPLFMVCIILTSNIWTWQEQKLVKTPRNVISRMLTAILLLVLAVLILIFSVTLA